ncbi:MAG: PAS domain-containing protein [Candidatus Cloacimonetes bacterium]|nr:PAS domain-containing protein [Candidatus Cloacimonadota bacterium]
MKFNPLTLSFEGELENKFREDYFSTSIWLLRISFILGIFYYTTFFFLDMAVLPEFLTELMIIRFLFVCPVILVIFFCSFTKNFYKWWQLGASIATVVAGLGIVVMTTIPNQLARSSYYTGIILVFIYGYMLIRLRFIWSTISCWLILIAYILSVIYYPGLDPKNGYVNIFFLISANILGMFGGYALEYYTRKKFYFRHLLNKERKKVKEANLELEAKVEEKTVELKKDILRRKIIEDELRESEKKLQNAQTIAGMGNFEWNFQTGEIFWSEQLYEIHGWDPKKGVPTYKQFLKHVHPQDRELVKKNVDKAMESGKYSCEYRIIRFDNGTIRYINTIGLIIFDNEDKPYMMQATEQDITKRKEVELELKKYRNNLEDIITERTKILEETQKELIEKQRLATLGELAGGISHEIRNPLATIDSSVVNLDMQNYSDEKIKKHIKKIHGAVKRSVEVIDSLNRLTKKEEPSLKKLDIKSVIQEFVHNIKIPSGVKINYLPTSEPLYIIGDKTQLNICLNNLLSNALDAIEMEGRIDIETEKLDIGECRIVISDTGHGIETDKLNKIFEPLYSSKAFGIGFGLSLVKQIVESHGGEIEISSQLGKGTEFTVLLPMAKNLE